MLAELPCGHLTHSTTLCTCNFSFRLLRSASNIPLLYSLVDYIIRRGNTGCTTTTRRNTTLLPRVVLLVLSSNPKKSTRNKKIQASYFDRQHDLFYFLNFGHYHSKECIQGSRKIRLHDPEEHFGRRDRLVAPAAAGTRRLRQKTTARWPNKQESRPLLFNGCIALIQTSGNKPFDP